MPDLIPQGEKALVKLLRAVRHIEKYPATDTKRGRPSRWRREDLLKVASGLKSILCRETSGRISIVTFIDHYVRVLNFPQDLITPLEDGNINLFEAEQLMRLSSKQSGLTPAEARNKRAELLSIHLQARLSGDRLRRRVNELLQSLRPRMSDSQPEFPSVHDLEDFDPYDTSHLLWEEIKQLGFAFRSIRREDVTDEMLDELLRASGPLWAVLTKIQRQGEKIKRNTLPT
ncbi:MAG: hypothetical protein ACJ74Q_11130 [Pyrinomonadaceae bacterium]